jgi:hypothetical protein
MSPRCARTPIPNANALRTINSMASAAWPSNGMSAGEGGRPTSGEWSTPQSVSSHPSISELNTGTIRHATAFRPEVIRTRDRRMRPAASSAITNNGSARNNRARRATDGRRMRPAYASARSGTFARSRSSSKPMSANVAVPAARTRDREISGTSTGSCESRRAESVTAGMPRSIAARWAPRVSVNDNPNSCRRSDGKGLGL